MYYVWYKTHGKLEVVTAISGEQAFKIAIAYSGWVEYCKI